MKSIKKAKYKIRQREKGLLDIPRLFMQLGGMWPVKEIKNKRLRVMYLVYKYFIYTYFLIFNISLTIEVVRLVSQEKDFERINTALGILVTIAYLQFKAVIFQKNEIPQTLLIFLRAERGIRESKDETIANLYKMKLKYCRYFTSCVIVFSIFTVFLFYIVSIAGSEGILNVGIECWDFEKRSFLHEFYIPFDKKKYFNLILGFNVGFTTIVVFLNVSCQSVLYAYIIFAITRLMILQINLEKFDILAKEHYSDPAVFIKKCIKEHQELIRVLKTLNDAAKYLLLMDFLLNSFKVGFNLFKVVTATSPSDFVFPLVYALMITWEVCSMGWICNEIKFQSLGIAEAAYQSLWYEQNKDTKRLLQIMMMRAQKPLTLTIGPFQPMTTETIVTILKGAYSYVTLMTEY